jgi:hypothetical protein
MIRVVTIIYVDHRQKCQEKKKGQVSEHPLIAENAPYFKLLIISFGFHTGC